MVVAPKPAQTKSARVYTAKPRVEVPAAGNGRRGTQGISLQNA